MPLRRLGKENDEVPTTTTVVPLIRLKNECWSDEGDGKNGGNWSVKGRNVGTIIHRDNVPEIWALRFEMLLLASDTHQPTSKDAAYHTGYG